MMEPEDQIEIIENVAVRGIVDPKVWNNIKSMIRFALQQQYEWGQKAGREESGKMRGYSITNIVFDEFSKDAQEKYANFTQVLTKVHTDANESTNYINGVCCGSGECEKQPDHTPEHCKEASCPCTESETGAEFCAKCGGNRVYHTKYGCISHGPRGIDEKGTPTCSCTIDDFVKKEY